MDNRDPLSIRQEIFLAWLVDTRPARHCPEEFFVHGLITEEAPTKGSRAQIAAMCDTTVQGLGKWQRNPVFQKAYKDRVKEELTDPTYMLEVVRNVRAIAAGQTEASGSEQIKAADLYSKLVGYQAPVMETPQAPTETLSDEELERLAQQEAAPKRPALSLVEALQ